MVKVYGLNHPESDPTGKALGDAGAKMDAGKPDMLTVCQQFPTALDMVSQVCIFGAETKGYGWDSWRSVPDADKRYRKAAIRHLIIDGDDESGIDSLAHAAWSALAALEIRINKDG